MTYEDKSKNIDTFNTNNINETIESIQNNKLNEHQLIMCLDVKHMYVVSNALIMLLKLKSKNKIIVEKSIKLSQYRGPRFSYAEGIAIGHFAIASLSIIDINNSEDEFQNLFDNFEYEEQEKVKKAIEILVDLTKKNI